MGIKLRATVFFFGYHYLLHVDILCFIYTVIDTKHLTKIPPEDPKDLQILPLCYQVCSAGHRETKVTYVRRPVSP